MKKFYEKHEIWFAVILIVIYSIGQSFAASLNEKTGIAYSANVILSIALTAFLLLFIFKNKLGKKFKLKKPEYPAVRFLFYIPLLVIVSRNAWNGLTVNYEPLDTACLVVHMLCVGIIEELLFRGFLFEAIAKDSIKQAVVISSITFGAGHLINLLNGISSGTVETVCQVIGAVAFGFLFVVIYYRGGSIIPCILTHSAIDALSAFANGAGVSTEERIILFAVMTTIIIVYTLILLKTLPKKQTISKPLTHKV